MGVLGEIRQRAQKRTSNLYDTYFTRQVSALLTAVLVPVGVSPNFVSLMNVVVGLGACALIAFGDSTAALTGVGLVHLYAVLDSVDGELARYLKRPSLKGVFIENWSAYLLISAFPLALGHYLGRTAGDARALWVAVAFAALFRSAMPAARRAIWETRHAPSAKAALPAPAPAGADAPASLERRLFLLVEDSLLHHTNIRLVLSTALALDVLWPAAHEASLLRLLFYAYLALLMLREVGILGLLLVTGRLERERADLVAPRPGERSP